MIVGSLVGSLIPLLWGAGALSFSSILFSTIGAMIGIYVAFKLTR
jgi:uncharacterized membrane protein YeaQ/YmgE (transglycosylase-associated protein family)